VLGVMTVLLVMVTQIIMLSYDTYYKQVARANIDANAILASRAISESARGALSVLATHTINGTSYSSDGSELVLQLPAVDASGNIIGGEYDYVAIYRDGTETEKIFSDIEAAATSYRFSGQKLITDHNEALIFRYDHPDYQQATRISILLRNSQIVRQSDILTETWSSIFIRNR